MIPAGSNPRAVCDLLANAVSAKAITGLRGAAEQDKVGANLPDPHRAFVKFAGAGRGRIEVSVTGLATSGTAHSQTIEVTKINPNRVIVDNAPRYVHVGSEQQRCLFYAFDTGGTNIDVVYVRNIANRLEQGADGYAVGEFADAHARHPSVRPLPKVANSILMSLLGGDNANKPYLLVHELGHVLIGTSMHVLAEQRFTHALMWAAPGDPGVHVTISEGAPPEENWMDSKWDAQGCLITDPVAAGNARLDAVGRMLAHPFAQAP
jgi:hypothetical protein